MPIEEISFKFQQGDVVSLPSGGPSLTVCKLEGATAVTCVWFDATGNVRREMFPVACLVSDSGDDTDDEYADNEIK